MADLDDPPRDPRPGGRVATRRAYEPGRARHRAVPTRHRARLPVLVGLIATFTVLAAGGAWAAWTVTGPGYSAAQAATALAPTTSAVAGSAITTGRLYPTGKGTVMIVVDNPNPYPVRVVSVAANGTVTAGGGTGTCSTTGVTLTTRNPGSVVAARGSATITLTDAAAMSADSDTGCQNATFTIPVTVTVESG